MDEEILLEAKEDARRLSEELAEEALADLIMMIRENQ